MGASVESACRRFLEITFRGGTGAVFYEFGYWATSRMGTCAICGTLVADAKSQTQILLDATRAVNDYQ